MTPAPLEDPDGHRWVWRAEPDCPGCRCCTARLCHLATAVRGFAHPGLEHARGVPCEYAPPRVEETVTGCPCTASLPHPSCRFVVGVLSGQPQSGGMKRPSATAIQSTQTVKDCSRLSRALCGNTVAMTRMINPSTMAARLKSARAAKCTPGTVKWLITYTFCVVDNGGSGQLAGNDRVPRFGAPGRSWMRRWGTIA